MSYLRQSLGVTPDQEKILLDVNEDDLRSMSTQERLDLAMRAREARATASSARWDALSTFATAMISITTFLGISSAFKIGKK